MCVMSFHFIFRKEDWLHCLDAVSTKLDVKEKMQMDEELVRFVKKKNRSENLTKKMNIWELFEPIVPTIRELFDKKMSEREFDAFDDDNIFCGVKIEDGLFYSNSFLPTALVYMYQHWLEFKVLNADVYNELFSLGTGAMTKTLVPEVSSFCKECADKSLNDGEIRQLNLAVFKKQIMHKFLDPAFHRFFDKQVDDQMKARKLSDDEEETKNCNPFVIDEENPGDIVRTNPFDSDDDDLFLEGCELCYTTFPSEEFLKFHKKIFHSKVLATKFVENAEELMLSISEGPETETEAEEPSTSLPTRKAQQESKKNGNTANERSERSVKSKYKLRKCLKY